jgi:hypothetical protein
VEIYIYHDNNNNTKVIKKSKEEGEEKKVVKIEYLKLNMKNGGIPNKLKKKIRITK